mmetsp:Transcript_2712/g.5851  ORF Transcript_2712/g.5851 Transcript_2712/m.5851 type:complete len:369 (-) Transcript_2712:1957-3063(-)
MADFSQVPLTFILQSKLLSNDSAQFVFSASQGINHEAVKNTSGALVKSITAFKSFAATKNHNEIFDRWLVVLAKEIIERVARDTVRNKRYPKSCTLNYTYYTTSNGHRPSTTNPGSSTRSQRQTRSLRLCFPSEREGTQQQKIASLLLQAKVKLTPIVKDHPLRGIGLSASNFIESLRSSTSPGGGIGSIQTFFSTKNSSVPHHSSSQTRACIGQTENEESTITETDTATAVGASFMIQETTSASTIRARSITMKRTHSQIMEPSSCSASSSSTNKLLLASTSTDAGTSRLPSPSKAVTPAKNRDDQHTSEITTHAVNTTEDSDLEFARKLQASFDRENYALSTANRRKKSTTSVKNTRRIDAFFTKR